MILHHQRDGSVKSKEKSEKLKPPPNLPEGRLIQKEMAKKKKQGSRTEALRFVSLVMMIMNVVI